jgi:cytoskeletal protein CcmA (bactofilin family)
MAANVTVIGKTTRVRGRLTGDVDLEVQGFVEGEIAVGGDVTIDSEGMVGAGIRGRRLVVRGAVRGDLTGNESISIEQGARVVGDLSAPRIAIAPGALVRGHVQTADTDGATPRASRAQSVARPVPVQAPVRSAPIAVAARPVAASPAVAPKVVPAPPPKAVAKPVAQAPAATPSSAGLRRPPPPVVPALRSAKGQIAKKKER